MKFYTALLAATLASTSAHAAKNAYVQTNFVADRAHYNAQMLEPDFVNAWGIAIRPAGAGGHFWVTAKDVSYQYVGDVQQSPDKALQKLHTDDLRYVKLPVGGDENFATGVAFSGSKTNFVITQNVSGEARITAPAKFFFASDGGIISAWTERKRADGTFDWPHEATAVIDESSNGAQFFGISLNADYSTLYAADFGAAPALKVYRGDFTPANITFDMPFDDNKNGVVDAGEYAPFNVQSLTLPDGKNHIFVAYAKTQPCPANAIQEGACKKGELWPGEEDISKPGHGRVAEFTEDGKLVAVWNDSGKLSAPWGFALAPSNFGKLSETLLVSNFGDGTIAAYNPATRQFVDYVRKPNGKPVVIDKIWGILFGNGQSLGDKNALYFAAGPRDETEGVFGVLRVAK